MGPVAAPAISSSVYVDPELTIITVPAAPAALAVVSSALGCALPCPPVGSSITSSSILCPRTVVVRSRRLTSTSIRGRNAMESKASRVLRRMISSVAPPAMKSYSCRGSSSLARASYS